MAQSYYPSMKIAQIAPIIESVPPKKYGGTERVVWALTEELVRRGHDVTLFATGDSQTSAKLSSVFPTGLREAFGKDTQQKALVSLLHLGKAYERQDEFDVIHDHTSHFGVSFAQNSRTPVVMTLHGAITDKTQHMFGLLKKPQLVCISQNQAQHALQLNVNEVVYNGLPMAHYPFGATHQGYLLFVGRICPEKGLEKAIAVAQQVNMPLIIAAKYEPELHAKYFTKYIQPHLNTQIKWIGEVSEAERNQLYAGAYCSLHATSWEEPFGLTLIEAMSCGCPVIALNQGSIPEVIEHGRTGFVVKDVQEMIQKVKEIKHINRHYCRTYALHTFNTQKMTDGYENLYYQMREAELGATTNLQHSIWTPVLKQLHLEWPAQLYNKYKQLTRKEDYALE